MGTIRVIGKRRSEGRCGYCLDRLETDQGIETCQGCNADMHSACKRELGGCPSIGCEFATERTRVVVPPSAPEARRRGRAWNAEPGRMTRQRPGLWVRLGPYMRMILRTAWHSTVLAFSVASLCLAFMNPAATWAWLEQSELGSSYGLFALFLMAVAWLWFVGVAVKWFMRFPGVWRRVGDVLDDGQVTPALMTICSTGTGKLKTWWARITPLDISMSRTIELKGISVPFWFRGRAGQRVWVHGYEDEDQPCVVEFQDGLLALLDPK